MPNRSGQRDICEYLKLLLMNKLALIILCLTGLAVSSAAQMNGLQVKTVNGMLEGVLENSGVRSFKGVAFAAPPVGDLRWKEPQPAKSWEGVRKCDHFGAMGVQPPIYSDMKFRASGMSEDCLYLNVWVPGSGDGAKGKSGAAVGAGGIAGGGNSAGLPVLVYFFGGGYIAGDGSEGRYDGESMATKGVIAITVTYRLGVFGFLAHPELTQESPHHASGNYGLLDQSAALRWVQQNIRAFGGDPARVTIAGESAGSVSVSAQMVSPLSKGLIAGAIGESGSLLGALPPVALASAEQTGLAFAKSCGAADLAALRAMPADKVLEAAKQFSSYRFPMTIDGYFLPKAPDAIFEAGEQAHVPLLVGWNSDEGNYKGIIGNDPPTRANYEKGVRKLYGAAADTVLGLYAVATDTDVEQVGTDLASDRFIAFSTWRWANEQAATGGKPVYRYLFERARPEEFPSEALTNEKEQGTTLRRSSSRGAVHSAEIEYAMGNLPLNKVYSWTAEDYAISKLMEEYFANFIKKGDPNGAGLPEWPTVRSGGAAQVMHINVKTRVETEKHRERYLHWVEVARGK
jgi:para-nitrobenzyl esterase